MNIALMCHNKKQELMVQFCTAYCGILAKHTVCATNATGRMVAEATGLNVNLFLSHEHGDIMYICRLCDQHSVPMATNVATAELLIHGLARGDLDWREVMNPNRVPFAL